MCVRRQNEHGLRAGETGDRSEWHQTDLANFANLRTASRSSGIASTFSALASAKREWCIAASRISASPIDANDSNAFCSRPATSMAPAPSRAIAVKASSNMSRKDIFGTSTRSHSGIRVSPSSIGSLQIAKSRTNVPIMPIAVPGSLTAGDNARLAISERTIRPNRGSSSNCLSLPIINARSICFASISDKSPESAVT